MTVFSWALVFIAMAAYDAFRVWIHRDASYPGAEGAGAAAMIALICLIGVTIRECLR